MKSLLMTDDETGKHHVEVVSDDPWERYIALTKLLNNGNHSAEYAAFIENAFTQTEKLTPDDKGEQD